MRTRVQPSLPISRLATTARSFLNAQDPTFRTHVDAESNETIISGMGELHLDIYVERMKREYGVECKIGEPRVNYRETISQRAEFNYLHKKQSGGAGQFARVIGYIEPLPEEETEFEFVNALVGNNVPPEYVSACEKGFREGATKGAQIGHPVQVRGRTKGVGSRAGESAPDQSIL